MEMTSQARKDSQEVSWTLAKVQCHEFKRYILNYEYLEQCQNCKLK